MNEYERNIQKAKQFVDQTNSNYVKATQDTKSAQSSYDQAFSSTPNYGDLYNQYKDQYTNTVDLANQKNSYLLAKDTADSVRSRVDKLGDSINQQFGGTSLTQAQRDLFKQKQLLDLQGQFTQYNANYKAQFTDYQKNVDRAFNESIDVANKSYDSYWDIVKIKYQTWNDRIKNQERWSESLSKANIQLNSANSAYNDFKRQQEYLDFERQMKLLDNQIARGMIKTRVNAGKLKALEKSTASWVKGVNQQYKNAGGTFRLNY